MTNRPLIIGVICLILAECIRWTQNFYEMAGCLLFNTTWFQIHGTLVWFGVVSGIVGLITELEQYFGQRKTNQKEE